MTAEEHQRERRYQMAMHVARKMLKEGLINRREYDLIDTKMTEKFAPVLGNLLSEI